MKTVKWGIIGAGGISSTFATALNAMENTEVLAVASRNLGRAQGFAKLYHAKKAYGSYEELVMDPEIDVIYIGTVNTEHKENAALCIAHGKSVLCEKPFTVNQQDTEYLIDLAKKHKVFLMEAMWTKFLPTTNTVKQWIKDKKIGEVKYFNISFGFQSEFDLKNRVYNPETAGGALLDVGIYPITYAIHMMGRLPDEISSSAHIGKSDVDEMNVIAFHYNEGVVADLSSAINAKIGMDAVIIGDKGKIIVPNFWMASSAILYDENNKEIDTISLPHKTNGYEYEAEEVNRCIREGKLESDILPLSDTLGIIQVMDKIRADWGLKYPTEK
ncbi:MAG: Gfo/Idh/MocA family oxidoreductase [Mobilitalea sp.]